MALHLRPATCGSTAESGVDVWNHAAISERGHHSQPTLMQKPHSLGSEPLLEERPKAMPQCGNAGHKLRRIAEHVDKGLDPGHFLRLRRQ